jgi:hypothetical protein
MSLGGELGRTSSIDAIIIVNSIPSCLKSEG